MFKETPESDLALEMPGASHSEVLKHGFALSKSTFGEYKASTLHLKDVLLTNEQKRRAAKALADAIKEISAPEIRISNAPVTVICLGNSSLVADSLGALCAKRIVATRSIKNENTALFDALGSREVTVIKSGVASETGIEAAELARMCVKILKPRLVIVIDSLRAASVKHLSSVIQVTDRGISPGSGAENKRKTLSYKTLGVPVISVGAPTVISAKTLVSEALKSLSIAPEIRNSPLSESETLSAELQKWSTLSVCQSNCDVSIKTLAEIISSGINLALHGDAFEKL